MYANPFSLGVVVVVFVVMLALVEVGHRLGAKRRVEGLGAIENAVFGLMGLLIAFTFGSAAVRFNARRGMIVEEANDIRAAYLRLDLLAPEAQPPLREAFRRYVDLRLALYASLRDRDAATADLAEIAKLQKTIWQAAVAASADSKSSGQGMLLLPALNAMFAVAKERTVALQTHQPAIIFVMLGVLMLACSLLAGVAMAAKQTHSWLHVVCFAAVLTIAFYVILDLEYPRIGVIRIDWMDQLLRDVRAEMN